MAEISPSELAKIADYIAQESSPEDIACMERRMDDSPELREFVGYLQKTQAVTAFRERVSDLDSERRAEQVLTRVSEVVRDGKSGFYTPPQGAPPEKGDVSVKQTIPAGDVAPYRSIFPAGRAWQLPLFAAFGILVAFSTWLFTSNDGETRSSDSFTYATSNGEQASVLLPDGSSVLLNVGTRLTVPADYSASRRSLQLDGEAFFSVEQSAKSPFTVYAGSSATRVLGTRFSVRHYASDTAVVVSVQEGRVSTQSLVLSANQSATVSGLGVASRRPLQPGEFSYISGILTLDYQPLIQAVPELNRWYDVDIRLASPDLAHERILGQFRKGSVSELMNIFEVILDLKVERSGRIITLYKR